MYIDNSELNILMPSIFLSSELNRVDWENVQDSDKNVLIGQAECYIDSLRYKGRRAEYGQMGAFPRYIKDTLIPINDDIKRAVCCVVYDLLDTSRDTRKQLIASGVKSISTGGVSESYADSVIEVGDRYKRYIGKYIFNGIL